MGILKWVEGAGCGFLIGRSLPKIERQKESLFFDALLYSQWISVQIVKKDKHAFPFVWTLEIDFKLFKTFEHYLDLILRPYRVVHVVLSRVVRYFWRSQKRRK